MTNRIYLQSPLTSPDHVSNSGLNLKIIYRRIDELKPDPANPRRHTKKQIRKIAGSIKAFGFSVPILVDRDGNVIAGHGRLLAVRQLGCSEVPTLCLDHLSRAQARAFMIADNRLTDISTWDNRVLAQQLKDLSLLGLDFSLELTGFEMPEIDLRIESLEKPLSRKDDPADQMHELPADAPLSKIRDLWILGDHRVLCGTALDSAAYTALMGAERAATVFTELPYNIPVVGSASGLGTIHQRPCSMASGETNRAEFATFLGQVFRNLAGFSIDGSLHYVCIDWCHTEELLSASRDVYGALKDLCVWIKDEGGSGSLYRSQHELVFVFKHGRAEHRNNAQRGRFRRNRSNVWHYPEAKSVARRRKGGSLRAMQATAKPVAMVADAILDGSARGEIVLDSFLGGGTTLIAAARTGRRCFGLEFNPSQVDTIIHRWQTLTGGRARNAASGRSFDDLALEAEAANAA
jgi:DNA modification methylase